MPKGEELAEITGNEEEIDRRTLKKGTRELRGVRILEKMGKQNADNGKTSDIVHAPVEVATFFWRSRRIGRPS